MAFTSSRIGLLLAVAVALVAGFLLRADLLDSGFYTDDFDHYAMQVGRYPVPRSHLDMFNFGNGTPAETKALIDSGHFPWWSAPNIHLSMFRPLSSALIAFDFNTFGLNARMFHWHSFAWWALLVIAVSCLLARVLPPPTAALAVLLFALEEGHSFPVGWLANRSTLVATTFGVLGVYTHVIFRQDRRKGMRWLSLGCVTLSLLSGEYAFGPLGYLLAFELVMRDEPRLVRARALVPAVSLAVVYLGVRQALGFGIEASGFYISSTAAPLAFLRAVCWRVPVLVGDLIFGVPADWYLSGSPWRGPLLRTGWFSPGAWRALPDWPAWHIGIGVVGLLVVVQCFRRLPAWLGTEHAKTVRFLLLGAVLSLLPGAGGMVSARLTVAASLGFDALIAALLFHTFAVVQQASSIRRTVAATLACTALLYVHVYAASARSEGDAYWQRYRAQLEYEWVMSAEVDAGRLPNQRVFVISSSDLTTAWYLPYIRAAMGASVPRSYTLLSGASQPHDLVRVSDRVLDLLVITNNVDLMAVGGNYRPADQPFHIGDTAEFQGIHAEVVRTLRGQPLAVRFTFPKSLDDPEYWFLQSTDRGLRRVVLPTIGQSLRLRRPVYPNPTSLRWRAQDARP